MEQMDARKRCIVIIPIYKPELDKDAEGCVRRYVDILKDRDICFVCPEHLDRNWYQERFENVQFVNFPDKFFTGTKSYNHLLLDTKFYDRFADYDYMLIAQDDACIMTETDMLDEFMDMGFDYFGAPWIPERRIWEWTFHKKKSFPFFRIRCAKKEGISMGNGGFCLRSVDKSKALIKEFAWRKIYWFIKRNEDIFFGLFGQYNRCGFKPADVETGLKFAREYNLKESIDKGLIPFGIHGYKKEFDSFEDMKNYMQERGYWKDSM